MTVLDADPRAHPNQTTQLGNVRVTVLTDRLLRIEYAQDATFEDRATLAVVNRRFPTVDVQVEVDAESLTVDTAAVELKVVDVTRPFTSQTLRASITHGADQVSWSYGKRGEANLGGTVRTLDGWRGRSTARVVGFDADTGFERVWEEQALGDGLLSRDGWVVIDDSASVVLDPHSDAGQPWPRPRADGARTDLYLFAYGTDHRAALAAGARLFGPQPLPPRFTFGYWYSRYFPYTDDEVMDLADQLDRHDIPTDVFVIDMDWHQPGWTGYSWDHVMFPDPSATLAALHERRMRVSLNLHPADGVGAHEDAFAAMCAAMGLDPDVVERVPFDVTDARFVDAYFRLLHHPEEERGVDLWWMDWQQGTETTMPGLDPLAWLNHLHWNDRIATDPSRRPAIFSRWSGLGAGRHPIGFSGDTYAVWESLAFQPEFTATAANVLYGYWSHDIGGHFGTEPDAELYTRWLQFGAHSPVLRTHGSVGLVEERRVWEYPDPYRTVMIDAIRHRYELVPYLYGECRRGVDTGLSLVRPMYHEHPELDEAYEVSGQYHLGEGLIVSPVVGPRGDDAMAEVSTWLPPGDWYDVAHGRTLHDRTGVGRWVTSHYLLEEVPVFARAGTVVPGQRDVDRLESACYPNLVLTAYPGRKGSHDLYEDDGHSQGYLKGRSVTVALRHRTMSRSRMLEIAPAEGSYRGWRARRDVEVRFVGEVPPTSVLVDDRLVERSERSEAGRWWFDALAASVVVSLVDVDLRKGAIVEIRRAAPARRREAEEVLDGYVGLQRRLRLLCDETRTLIGDDNRHTVALARAGERISAEPASLVRELELVRAGLDELPEMLVRHTARARELETLNPDRPPRSSDQLDRADRMLSRTREQFT